MDAAEFDAFYGASFHRLVGQLYALIGDRDEAAECVQEAFARAWSHHRALDRAAAPEAWVRTTAHRLAVSRWRRTVRALRARDRTVPGHLAEPSADHVAVVTALRRLPFAQRQAIVLHHLCDLSVAAVALEVGAPVSTVKARLSRGRLALQALLRDEPRDESTGREETTGRGETTKGAGHV